MKRKIYDLIENYLLENKNSQVPDVLAIYKSCQIITEEEYKSLNQQFEELNRLDNFWNIKK
jgi:hypothetical protein